jgi:hypothetical protein
MQKNEILPIASLKTIGSCSFKQLKVFLTLLLIIRGQYSNFDTYNYIHTMLNCQSVSFTMENTVTIK